MAPESSSSSEHHQSIDTPLISSYNERILPLMDAVDRLRSLKVMSQGIQLPTIVVIGDQSSGKSSLLESLAGISLPKGLGTCTRVPLIMRLQNSADSTQILQLEYNGKEVPTDEQGIGGAVSAATEEIAGKGESISKTPLTLLVKRKGVPNLTLIDLPGITRVPVGNQPKDICQQVYNIIMEYISQKESIIVNVMSATVHFPLCESLTMSKEVDPSGMRTLVVITRADKDPEELIEKINIHSVRLSQGLGYVCVRNRIKKETIEEARVNEALLFKDDPHLSTIKKSIVGIPILAQKLMQIQAAAISDVLPDISSKITDQLNNNLSELNKIPQTLTTIVEAALALKWVLSNATQTLRNVLIRGEYHEYKKKYEMHCGARLADMLAKCHEELVSKLHVNGEHFLMDEVKLLMESKGIALLSSFVRVAFSTLLEDKVDQIAKIPLDFMDKAWNYIEKVVVAVLIEKLDIYPQLQSLTRRASKNLMTKVKTRALDWVNEIIKMEKFTDYTCHGEYFRIWNKLMGQREKFLEMFTDSSSAYVLDLEIFGEVDVSHLKGMHLSILQQAFEVKARLTAYLSIVLARIVDNLALYLTSRIKDLVNEEMETEILREIMDDSDGGGGGGSGIKRMLEEPPCIASKRVKLNENIVLLQESKIVMDNIMDRFSN